VIPAQRLQVGFVADAAEDLVSKHGRRDQVLAAASGNFRCRQGGGYAVARMAGFTGARVAVVEIQETDHHAVGEDGEIRARTLAAHHYRGRPGARNRLRDVPRDLCGPAAGAAKRAAQRVNDQALSLMRYLTGQVLVAQRGGIRTQLLDYRCHFSDFSLPFARGWGELGITAGNLVPDPRWVTRLE